MLSKENVDTAWKLYNHLNTWERHIFGGRTLNNASYIFIISLVALHGELSITELTTASGVGYRDIFRYMDSLTRYFKFIVCENGKYKVSSELLKSIKDVEFKDNPVNQKVFCTVMNNMKYHTKILQEHLQLDKDNGKFKMMRALLNPVISNPIRANDCKKLSSLGYMKYRPQSKELKLNAVAYEKDWIGTHVI